MLNDSTGLHMGAGPYMLIYSKVVDPETEVENMEEVAAKYDSGVKVSKALFCNFIANGCFFISLGGDRSMEPPVPGAAAGRASERDGAGGPAERVQRRECGGGQRG